MSADNWLSALRAGRKELGEEGGVPQGASCVMSATGDVTILDAARRRRYVLVRAVPAATIEADSPGSTRDSELPSAPLEAAASAPAELAAEAPAASSQAEPLDATHGHAPRVVAVPVASELPVVAEPSRDASAESATREPPGAALPAPDASASATAPAVGSEHRAAIADTIGEKSSERPLPADSEAAGVQDVATDASEADDTERAVGEQTGARGLPRAKQTLAYSALRAQALKREFETSRSLLSPSTSASGAPLTDASKALPRPSLHAVPPEQRGLGPASSIPPAPKLPADARIRPLSEPARAPVEPAKEASLRSQSEPARSPSEPARSASDSARPRRSMPSVPRFDGLVPISGRDVDPTPQSPLTYRERSYLVARSADRERLEGLLQAQFVTLRRELAGKQRGQLIHLAVFDHSFEDKPLRPPIATLEWRDWRGNAVFTMASDGSAAAEPPAAPPTTRAAESSWPVPLLGQPAPPASSLPAAPVEPVRAPSERPASAPPRQPAPPFDLPVTQPSSASAQSAAVTSPADIFGALQPLENSGSGRPSSSPPTASSWPIPATTPLEPARVLAAAWPVAPQPATASSLPPPSEPFLPASSGSPNSDPFGPVLAKPAPAESAAPAPLPAAFVPVAPRALPTDVFAAVPAAAVTAPAPTAPAPTAPVTRAAEPAVPPPAAAALAAVAAFGPAHSAPQAADSWGFVDGRREPTGENDSRLATAFEAMPDLYFLPTPVAGLEFTIQLIGRLVGSEAISCCLYDINMDVFRFVVLTGTGAIERRAGSVPSSAGLFGVAKRELGDALVVNDVTAERRFDAAVDGRDGLAVKTLAYVPVRHAGQLLGILQLINRANERGFTASDVAVLSYVTAQVAEFLATRRSLMG